MDLKIRTNTDFLSIFDNVKNLKTLLKPISCKTSAKLFRDIESRADLLASTIQKHFHHQNNDFKINCLLYTNSCIVIYAYFGGGLDFGYGILDENGFDVSHDSDLKNAILSNYLFPSTILITEIKLDQQILHYTSVFTFINEISSHPNRLKKM